MPGFRRYKKLSKVDHTNFGTGEDPAICMIFSKEPSKEQFLKSTERTLMDCGFLVYRSESRDEDEYFLKVSLPEYRLLDLAEKQGVRLRLKEVHGKALYEYKNEMREYYEKSTEGTLLSSAQQLDLIDFAIKAPGEHGGAGIELDELKEKHVIPEEGYFRLHYAPQRQLLEDRWAKAWTKPQPLEEIREYFGEKVSLYFAWLGHYTISLWVPALCGIWVALSQLYTSMVYDSLDNPWVPLYCVFTALWAVFFLMTWKRIEQTLQLQWDTADFEEQEEEREEFEKTDKKRDRITGKEVMYYPPHKRQLKQVATTTCVVAFISMVLAVVTSIMVLKHLLTQEFGPIGGGVGGILNAVSIMIFNTIYGKVVIAMNDWENWATETQYEDALIAKDFCFKFVNSYFALFFVSFIQNNVPVLGYDLHCPKFNCMPVLTMTLGIVFGTQIVVQQSMEIGMPLIKKRIREWQEERELKKLDKEVKAMSPEEEQSKMESYEGVFDDYNEMVVQFGYVTLFAAAFPLTAALALINNIMEIRIDALKMVVATRRAEYTVAADIGTWMSILEIMTSVCIMTNCMLVGFVSNGLYFYFPDLTPETKIWTVIMAEHVLFLLKAFLESVLGDPPKREQEMYDAEQYHKEKAIKKFHKQAAAEREAEEEAFGDDGDLR